ncbi:hypothetical protein AC579_7787 [Pseudocercospora musae]|uniref:Uncharacterized protein n=1 Tax=Pseudocercospora musae TaxID=113226 RepID=A0A139IK94_9PEZI|nr:hypothetical protein AC579_7787 [Pseudocercospora musae]
MIPLKLCRNLYTPNEEVAALICAAALLRDYVINAGHEAVYVINAGHEAVYVINAGHEDVHLITSFGSPMVTDWLEKRIHYGSITLS